MGSRKVEVRFVGESGKRRFRHRDDITVEIDEVSDAVTPIP
jgi:hypothetical protein